MSLGSLLLALAAAAPEASAAPPPSTPQVTAQPAAQEGVIAYPAEFFAAAQPNNAMEMINRLPGFSFDSGGEVRGFGGAAGNVLIDGERPASKSDDLESILRRIPAGQVVRIDLIRGGAPGIDMQGKTVVANIVRKQGAAVTGLIAVANTLTYDGRLAPAVRLETTRRNGDRSLEASIVVAGFIDDGDGDGWKVRRNGAGLQTLRTEVETEGDGTQAVATGAFATPLFGGKFRINGQLFHEQYEEDITERVLSGIGSNYVERAVNKRNRGEVGLRWSRDLNPKLGLETTFLQNIRKTDFYDFYVEPGYEALFTDVHTTGETVGRAVLRYRRSDTLSFEAGGEAAYNWLKSNTDYTENGAAIDLPTANVKVTEARGELFVSGTWKATPTLNIEAAMTVEASVITSTIPATLTDPELVKEKTLYFPKPRVNVTWSPNPANQFRFKVEREVGQLDFGDFVASSSLSNGVIHAGNPDLEPQQDWLLEAVYERRFWGSGALTFTLRRFQYEDVVDRAPIFLTPPDCNPVPDPNACVFDAPFNIGEGSRDAFIFGFNLPLDRLGLKGGRLRGDSWMRRSEVTDPTTGEKRPQSGMHPVDWELHFTHDLPKYHVNWGIDAFGAWRETYYRYNEVETYKLRTYVIPFLEYKPRRDITMRFELQNATERGFERIRQVYTGPRGAPGTTLDRIDTRELGFGRMLYIRIRKTIG